MLPIRDTIRARRFPYLNITLILVNVLLFLFEASLGQAGLQSLLGRYGLVPARMSLTDPQSLTALFSSMFLHGSWFHLISNMWTLYIFGDNVEERMGSGRYLVFYLLAGVIAGLTHVYFAADSRLPTIGASGAIAGVLGAYFVLFPRGRVLTLIPVFFLPWFVEVPAFVFLGVWFFSQLSSGLLSLGNLSGGGAFSGIAWWAHIGGFVAGLFFVHMFARRQRPVWRQDVYRL
ncbi:MAG TPA: rhomboid family intramembrane serine protease [Anaerolineales bacterium]|jgi:membrane associated rhomboid family serine protease